MKPNEVTKMHGIGRTTGQENKLPPKRATVNDLLAAAAADRPAAKIQSTPAATAANMPAANIQCTPAAASADLPSAKIQCSPATADDEADRPAVKRKLSDIDRAVFTWLRVQPHFSAAPVTLQAVRDTARHFAQEFGFTGFKAGKGWFRGFMQRYSGRLAGVAFADAPGKLAGIVVANTPALGTVQKTLSPNSPDKLTGIAVVNTPALGTVQKTVSPNAPDKLTGIAVANAPVLEALSSQHQGTSDTNHVKTESSPFDDSSSTPVPDYRVDVPGPSGTGGGDAKAPAASSRPVRTFDFDGGAAAEEDGMAVGGGQRAMMTDEESGSGGGSAGLCGLGGIEAVVAAAAAAAAADESSINTASNSGGMVVTSGGTATPLPVAGGGGMTGACQRPPVIGMSPPSAPTTPNKPESYQLRHNNHLSLVLNQLAEDEAFMDVTLTAEGRPVKAHKSVLSAVSPYFSSVLRANPCQHPIIIMPRDIRFSELSSIIMYIYKGEMTVSAEDLPSLLKTAELLRITGLSPGENSSSQQQFSRHSTSGGSNAFLSSDFNAMTTVHNQNISVSSSNSSNNSNVAMTSRGSNVARQQHQQQSTPQQRPQEQQVPNRVEKTSKPPTTEIESPPPPDHTMLNPSDFMDLDMTCVKEELNSDNEEEDTETSSREVTTPPPMGNPLSPDKDKTSSSPHSQPTLDMDPDSTRPTRSPSVRTDSTSQDTNQEADDMKLNSLKTLANLASLDTPTNLSPSDSSSPASNYDPSPNVCPYCSEYVAGEQIKSHLSSKHLYKSAHVCNTCFRVYTKKSLFESHSKECSKEF